MVFINDTNISYNVVLQSPVHKKVSITGWRSTNPAIDVQAPRNQPAETQHITIKVHTAENEISLNGRIIFTLDNWARNKFGYYEWFYNASLKVFSACRALTAIRVSEMSRFLKRQ